MLDYGHVAYAYEHTRGQVRDRILNTDRFAAYFVYAIRSGCVKKIRALQHGIPDVGWYSSLMRCVELRRAQKGNITSLNYLMDWWAPEYEAPTSSVWELKEDYLNLLVAQERITEEKKKLLANTVPQEEQPITSWSDIKEGGYRS
eukprot:TRINITY_DN1769_c3_g1_i1.p1 TRINITY_DN1769_c3_g1~~TRINITY_DN1769_c3_g1_i1.p1  ORF type:complete len:145 (+),score=2.03 TRINITY_DN1769_c3_g1_i1:53-487(+)